MKNQPKKALSYFDWALNYLLNNETINAIRRFCKFRLGEENGANRGWDRANVLADRKGINVDFKNMALNSGNLKDFESMLNYVKK